MLPNHHAPRERTSATKTVPTNPVTFNSATLMEEGPLLKSLVRIRWRSFLLFQQKNTKKYSLVFANFVLHDGM